MATVHALHRLVLRPQLPSTVAGRGPSVPGPSLSLLQTLAPAGRWLLGAVLLLLGIAMMSTLLLLPIGLPLALLAVALIAAPDSP